MQCSGASHLRLHTQLIIENDGEGVILRLCGSNYEHGRNASLIKLKVLFFCIIFILFFFLFCFFIIFYYFEKKKNTNIFILDICG